MGYGATPDLDAVLNGAPLSVPPAPLAFDTETPVVVWRRDAAAVVLSITRDDDEDAEEPFSVNIDIYEKVAGQWMCMVSGGSDWPVAYGQRPPIVRPALTGFCTCAEVDGDQLCGWSGIAPSGVARVRVAMDGFDPSAMVEPTTGAFLVVGCGGADFAQLDAALVAEP